MKNIITIYSRDKNVGGDKFLGFMISNIFKKRNLVPSSMTKLSLKCLYIYTEVLSKYVTT